jgi:hypothetical protein
VLGVWFPRMKERGTAKQPLLPPRQDVDVLASARPTVRPLYTGKFKFRRVYRVFRVGSIESGDSICRSAAVRGVTAVLPRAWAVDIADRI